MIGKRSRSNNLREWKSYQEHAPFLEAYADVEGRVISLSSTALTIELKDEGGALKVPMELIHEDDLAKTRAGESWRVIKIRRWFLARKGILL